MVIFGFYRQRLQRNGIVGSRGSSVSILTALRDGRPKEPWFDSRLGKHIIPKATRLTLWPEQRPFQRVLRIINPAVKRSRGKVYCLPLSTVKVKNVWSDTSTLP